MRRSSGENTKSSFFLDPKDFFLSVPQVLCGLLLPCTLAPMISGTSWPKQFQPEAGFWTSKAGWIHYWQLVKTMFKIHSFYFIWSNQLSYIYIYIFLYIHIYLHIIYIYMCVCVLFFNKHFHLGWWFSLAPGELNSHFGAQSVSNSLWTLATMRWRLGGLGSLSELLGSMMGTTLWLCQNSYWKWPFIVDFPIKDGDFP